VNNDVAAALVGALYFWALVRLGRRGLRPGPVGALILLAAASLGVKKTSAFLIPLTVLVLVSAAWRQRGRRRKGLDWRWLAGLAVALAAVAGAGVLLFQAAGPEPAGWLDGALPGWEGRSRAAAHSGQYGLRVPNGWCRPSQPTRWPARRWSSVPLSAARRAWRPAGWAWLTT